MTNPSGGSMIGGYSEAHLLRVAADEAEKKTKSAGGILSQDAEARVPRFILSELEVGKVLGRGGFCVVSEITKVSPKSTDLTISKEEENRNGLSNGSGNSFFDSSRDDDLIQDRTFMAKHYIREGKNYRYAIKVLQDSVREDAQVYVKSVIDLAIEAKFLSVLRHQNIIRMRSMANTSPFDEGKPFFLILDKLYEILSMRLKKSWKSRMPNFLSKNSEKAKEFWTERLTVAYDICSALKYMHHMHVIYRDIKPDNIGFDVRGNVKLFDFGLSKALSPSDRAEDGTFMLTGDSGSPRYMAPEVALEKPYNETCDVYSYSILLWQVLKVETPFDNYSSKASFHQKVIKAGVRPKPDAKWPEPLVKIMKSGWDADLHKRPAMEVFSETLSTLIREATGEARESIMDTSDKSLAK